MHRVPATSWTRQAAWFICCGVLTLAGCGPGYRTIDMRGDVSVDGMRANAGHLTFIPVAAGMGRGGMAFIQPDGTYHLRNVPIGEVTFTIVPEQKSGRQVPASLPLGGTALADEVTLMLTGTSAAGRGRATITMQVTTSSKQHDFALQATETSGPARR